MLSRRHRHVIAHGRRLLIELARHRRRGLQEGEAFHFDGGIDSMKTCDPNCLSCHGGHAMNYLANDDGHCMVCGGEVKDSEAQARRDALIEMRLDELASLLHLFRRQLRTGDVQRGFNLNRSRGLLDEIAKIEAVNVDAFRNDGAKKRKVDPKV